MMKWVKVLVCGMALVVSACQTTEGTGSARGNKLLYDAFFPDYEWPQYSHKYRQPYEISDPTGWGICSDYGVWSSPGGTRTRNPHVGIDICGSEGDDIIAAHDGIVFHAGLKKYLGGESEPHFVEICTPTPLEEFASDSHPLRDKGVVLTLCSRYLHMSAYIVEKGQTVKRGQKIGEMGNTGTYGSTYKHLHFETIWNETEIGGGITRVANPHQFWFDGQGKITCFESGKNYPGSFRLTFPLPCKS